MCVSYCVCSTLCDKWVVPVLLFDQCVVVCPADLLCSACVVSVGLGVSVSPSLSPLSGIVRERHESCSGECDVVAGTCEYFSNERT